VVFLKLDKHTVEDLPSVPVRTRCCVPASLSLAVDRHCQLFGCFLGCV
jgi:hypothetical protein